jgi:hypothetical protein
VFCRGFGQSGACSRHRRTPRLHLYLFGLYHFSSSNKNYGKLLVVPFKKIIRVGLQSYYPHIYTFTNQKDVSILRRARGARENIRCGPGEEIVTLAQSQNSKFERQKSKLSQQMHILAFSQHLCAPAECDACSVTKPGS